MIDPRWRTVLTIAPYVVIVALIARALAADQGDPPRLLTETLLCVATGAWIAIFRQIRWPWRDHPAVIAVFLIGLVALNLLLVLQDGWFGFLAIASYSFAYSIVPWPWQLLPVTATATVAGIAQSSGFGDDGARPWWTLAVIGVNAVLMCGLGWGVHLAKRQSELAATGIERSRLAREIHDTLAQGFVGIVTQLQAAEQAADETARRRHTAAALALARDGVAEARRSVQALRPAALDGARLAEAIEGTARRWSDRTGIPVEVRLSGSARPLPTEVEVALLRTAQEALANVERHAQAGRVALALRAGSDRIRLEVQDDGRGFDPGRDPQPDRSDGGYGLIAMRERVESVDGELRVESRPGHGTAIRVEVPA